MFARELYKAVPGVRKIRGQDGPGRTQEYCGIRRWIHVQRNWLGRHQSHGISAL